MVFFYNKVNPKVWTTKQGRFTFYMSKLTREERLEIYQKRKYGETISSLSIKYGINEAKIRYLIRLIDKHGENILRKDKNRYYSSELKLEIINKVLIDKQSIISTAIEYGLTSSGILDNWLKSYKENGYNIVEKSRGRPSTMKKEIKPIDPNDKDAIIKQKDEEILRLNAEIEYLKKLQAVVQARKNRQQKKK